MYECVNILTTATFSYAWIFQIFTACDTTYMYMYAIYTYIQISLHF